LRRLIVAVVAVLATLVPLHDARVRADAEVRALWVVRTSLSSPGAIDTMIKAASAGGFNTLLVQVRGRGDAYYAGGLEPRPAALAGEPTFDPLATAIARAHEAGLQVHAWINVNLVSAANELPSARDHIVYRHPEWLMIPRALAEDLAGVDARSPEYLGRLSRHVRSRATEIEGLYLSPITPEATDHTVSVVRDIVNRYAVDGVHLDYARYPAEDFDYSREALAAFRRSVAADLRPAERQMYDRRLVEEPIIYTQAFPERWRMFRTERLTALVQKVGTAVRSVRPAATISAAVMPDASDASLRRFQDWGGWLRHNLIDVVCPMAYTADAATFVSQVTAAQAISGPHPLWAGIGAYRLSQGQIVENVHAARRLGVGGVILFSYDALTGPMRGPEYLSEVGRAAFNMQ